MISYSLYPKVRVRDHRGDDEEEETLYYRQRDSCLNSSDPQSSFSVSEQEEDSQKFVAKIPKIYLPGAIKSPSSKSEEKVKHTRRVDRGGKADIHASPIQRPRAVVSSPDNDEMIGNINRIETKGGKVSKSPDRILNRHSWRGDHIDTDPGVKIGHRVSKSSRTTVSGNSTTRGSKTKMSKRLSP